LIGANRKQGVTLFQGEFGAAVCPKVIDAILTGEAIATEADQVCGISDLFLGVSACDSAYLISRLSRG
jgi:hypothetical protein